MTSSIDAIPDPVLRDWGLDFLSDLMEPPSHLLDQAYALDQARQKLNSINLTDVLSELDYSISSNDAQADIGDIHVELTSRSKKAVIEAIKDPLDEALPELEAHVEQLKTAFVQQFKTLCLLATRQGLTEKDWQAKQWIQEFGRLKDLSFQGDVLTFLMNSPLDPTVWAPQLRATGWTWQDTWWEAYARADRPTATAWLPEVLHDDLKYESAHSSKYVWKGLPHPKRAAFEKIWQWALKKALHPANPAVTAALAHIPAELQQPEHWSNWRPFRERLSDLIDYSKGRDALTLKADQVLNHLKNMLDNLGWHAWAGLTMDVNTLSPDTRPSEKFSKLFGLKLSSLLNHLENTGEPMAMGHLRVLMENSELKEEAQALKSFLNEHRVPEASVAPPRVRM